MRRALDYEYRQADGSSATLESITKAIAAKLISSAMPYGSDQPDTVRTALEKLFGRAGMPVPWADQSAAPDLRANSPRLPIVATNHPQLAPIVAGIAELEDWNERTDAGAIDDEEIRAALVDAAAIRQDLEALAAAPDVDDRVYEALLTRLGAVERELRGLLQESEVGA